MHLERQELGYGDRRDELFAGAPSSVVAKLVANQAARNVDSM